MRVTTSAAPASATLWSATNPNARDFRLETFGKQWTATPLTPIGPNTWEIRVPAPAKGWTAYFAEFTFDVGAKSAAEGHHRRPCDTGHAAVSSAEPLGNPLNL